MGFIMDGLDAEAYDREYTDRQLLTRIISYFRPHLAMMGIVAGLIVLNSVMDAAFPFLIARSLDRLENAAGLNQTIWQRTAWLIAAIFAVRRAILDLQLFPPKVYGAYGRRCGAEAAPGCL